MGDVANCVQLYEMHRNQRQQKALTSVFIGCPEDMGIELPWLYPPPPPPVSGGGDRHWLVPKKNCNSVILHRIA